MQRHSNLSCQILLHRPYPRSGFSPFNDIARRIVFKKPVAVKLITTTDVRPPAGRGQATWWFSAWSAWATVFRFSFVIRHMKIGGVLALIEGEAHGYERHKSRSHAQ